MNLPINIGELEEKYEEYVLGIVNEDMVIDDSPKDAVKVTGEGLMRVQIEVDLSQMWGSGDTVQKIIEEAVIAELKKYVVKQLKTDKEIQALFDVARAQAIVAVAQRVGVTAKKAVGDLNFDEIKKGKPGRRIKVDG